MERADKSGAISVRGLLLVPVELILYFILFYTVPDVKTTSGTKIFLLLISAGAALVCHLMTKNGSMEKYGRGHKIACLLIAVYAALASFAQRFFFEGYSRMHLSLGGIVCCLLALLWFLPVIWAMLCLMERLSAVGERKERPGSVRYSLLIFLLFCVWQGIIFMAFRPGGFPPDSVSQLFQAIGFEKIHDWHPALHTLCFRLILKLSGNRAMMIVAVQMLAFAALTAGYVSLFVRWGANKTMAAAAGLVFLMLPNNVLSEVSAVKDFPYTLSLLWATLILLRLGGILYRESGEKLWPELARLSLAIFLIFGFRHNGIIPAAFIIITLAVLTVRHYERLRLKAMAAAALSVLMMLIYKGPVFKMLDVQPNTASPYTTMLCAVGSCINQGLPLSDEATAIMESVIPLEDWAEYYNKYEGHDEYNWGRGEDETFNTEHITARDAFRVYLEALFRYPDVVIKDRLDGTDILWDVQRPADSFNEKSFDKIYFLPYSEMFFNISGMEEKGYMQYARPSALADFYRDCTKVSIQSSTDMLLWRTGSYLILMLTALVYISANGKKHILIAAMPLAGNIFGLLFLLYHQSFRYVYAMQPMILALVTAALFAKAKEETHKAS